MNKNAKLIGCHVDVDEILELKGMTKTFQIYTSDPQVWEMPKPDVLKRAVDLMQSEHLNLVIHCPYLVTLVKNKPSLNHFTKEYVVSTYRLLKTYYPGVKIPFVLHTGKPDKSVDIHTVLVFLEKSVGNLLAAFDRYGLDNACVAIETDANCYSPATQLDGIFQVVSSYGDPRVGICFDTEHSYASGRSGAIPEVCWDWIRVVHLNSIGKSVIFGKGRDVHHEPLNASKELEWILGVGKEAKARKIPMILERREIPVIEEDIVFLNEALS